MTIFPRKELGQIDDDDDELHRNSQLILQELWGEEKRQQFISFL